MISLLVESDITEDDSDITTWPVDITEAPPAMASTLARIRQSSRWPARSELEREHGSEHVHGTGSPELRTTRTATLRFEARGPQLEARARPRAGAVPDHKKGPPLPGGRCNLARYR